MNDYVQGIPVGYVVVTYNQASHWPGVEHASLHDTVEDAREDAKGMTARTKSVGRREQHVVAAVVELPEED